MKSIFSKVFKQPKQEPSSSILLSIPDQIHVDSFKDMNERSILGWIVYHMTELQGMDDQKRNALFFKSFMFDSLDDFEDIEIRELFKLAEYGLNWLRNNDLIDEEVKNIHTSSSISQALVKVLNDSDLRSLVSMANSDKEIWKVYRDVIYSVTQGTFLLIEKDKVSDYKQSVLLCEVGLTERQDLSLARNTAKEAFIKEGLKESSLMSYNLVISEAVTNVFKHANNGKMFVYKYDNQFRVIVEDNGPGFPLSILPKTTLMAGYSTKESLGQGFTLMMKMCKQVLLETSSQGSSLILVLEGRGDS